MNGVLVFVTVILAYLAFIAAVLAALMFIVSKVDCKWDVKRAWDEATKRAADRQGKS